MKPMAKAAFPAAGRISAGAWRNASWEAILPYAVVAVFLLVVVRPFWPVRQTGFDIHAFGKLPVLSHGRVKPLDSIARHSLLMFSGRQTLEADGRTLSALDWLHEMLFRPDAANRRKVFEINDPDVLSLLGKADIRERRYSFEDLHSFLGEIGNQAQTAEPVKPERRTRFQTAIVHLQERLLLYQRLQNSLQVAGAENVVLELNDFQASIPPAVEALKRHEKNSGEGLPALNRLSRYFQRYRFLAEASAFYALPVEEAAETPWRTLGEALLDVIKTGELHPGAAAYATVADAYRRGDDEAYNAAVAGHHDWVTARFPRMASLVRYEFFFNRAQFFLNAMAVYAAAFLAACLSWLWKPRPLQRTAFALLLLAFAVHTAGLASRMVIQGRPPVTNLYSSAIFVGWASVLLGLVLERIYRNALGSAAAAGIGFATLIVAHHLSLGGDTLEMMRAVLDSNFWLATHVVTITIGYSSTFLAGGLGIFYIIRGLFTRSLTPELSRQWARMAYGIVCFSTLFSFVGTILGGIWADQSWGRFWGWDPKENGALMIVLWNALILHARWGGFARQRGLMVLAVAGNIVTALSWFGVNMLGIGLHSYGFMDKAFPWLMAFVASQLVIVGLGSLPLRHWRSRIG
jgi:ABC-type transport system involved in cytochrome c biogenesis permease subunit